VVQLEIMNGKRHEKRLDQPGGPELQESRRCRPATGGPHFFPPPIAALQPALVCQPALERPGLLQLRAGFRAALLSVKGPRRR